MIWSLYILGTIDLLAAGFAEQQGAYFDRWFILIHVLVTGVALVACRHRMLGTGSLDPVGLVIAASFGPGGILALMLARPPKWFGRQRREKLAYVKAKENGAPGYKLDDTKSMIARTLDDRISYPEPDQIGSLSSTLRYGDRESRHRALQAVVRSFEPQLSPLIAVALTDQDQTLRALAATASAQIHQDVGQRFIEMEKKLSQGASIEETLPLVLSIADHGLHNVLLPQAHRLHLTQSSSRFLEELGPQVPGPQQRQVIAAQREIARADAQRLGEAASQRGQR